MHSKSINPESNLIEKQNKFINNDEVETIDSSHDEEIIQAVREDKSKFVHVYQRYVKDVYRYSLSRVNNQQEAEDITSHTFLTALKSFDQYRGDGCFGAYLIGISKRLIAKSYNQKEIGWLEEIGHAKESKFLAEEQVINKINLDQVVKELAAIPKNRAEAIRLHYFAGLKIGEVAKVMKKSEMAVRMLLHRGINDLKKQLLKGNEIQGEKNETND